MSARRFRAGGGTGAACDSPYRGIAGMQERTTTGISRREFLNRIALLGSLAVCYPVAALGQRRMAAESQPPPDWRREEPWITLAEVQEHLFPAAADMPGASDIQAIDYLHNAIENPGPDAADREFLFNGGFSLPADTRTSRLRVDRQGLPGTGLSPAAHHARHPEQGARQAPQLRVFRLLRELRLRHRRQGQRPGGAAGPGGYHGAL